MAMKTIWIVDGAHLFAEAGKAGRKLDYLRLKAFLEGLSGASFFESYYLNSTSDPPSDQQNSFHAWLKRAPPHGPKMRVQLYNLKEMHIRCPNGEYMVHQVQKGVDVGIATLALKLAVQDRYERLLLAAGDGDFEDAIDYIKSERHKEIWLCGFASSMSADLQSYADRVIWLDDQWDSIERP